jgi:hypothetical protein
VLACEAPSCPVAVRMAGGGLLVRYPQPWMLVEVLTAFVHVHRLLHGACGLLPKGHLP